MITDLFEKEQKNVDQPQENLQHAIESGKSWRNFAMYGPQIPVDYGKAFYKWTSGETVARTGAVALEPYLRKKW